MLTLGAWAKFPLPFSPVPITLQTLAVLIVSMTLPAPRATAGVLLYLGLGMAGAPLFAGGVYGPTFGYILGFVVSPYVATLARRPIAQIIAITAAIYALGAGWLILAMHISVRGAILMGIVPFLIGDAAKAAAAYGIVRWLRTLRSTP